MSARRQAIILSTETKNDLVEEVAQNQTRLDSLRETLRVEVAGTAQLKLTQQSG